MKRILVTGANGYLGGWLLKEITRLGWYVSGLDSHGGLVYGPSIMHPKEADAIVHLAWYSSAGDKHSALQLSCLNATKQLVSRCSDSIPFVFASTASVYGDGGTKEWSERDEPQPNCAYSMSKALAESIINTDLRKPVIFRFGSMMGLGVTRTKTEVCVNGLASEGWTRGTIDLWNPDSYKPLIHVRDAAELIIQAIQEQWVGTYNAAVDSLRAIEVAEMVRAVTGAEIRTVEDRTGTRSCRLDCRKLIDKRQGNLLPRTVQQTIMEFKGFVPSPSDRNIPWTI